MDRGEPDPWSGEPAWIRWLGELKVKWERFYQSPTNEVDGLSIPGLVALWAFKILLVWPIWFPCWLAYKTVYVAIPLGLGLWVAGAVLDNKTLAYVGPALVFGVGILGLMMRFYVWAFKIRFGDDED